MSVVLAVAAVWTLLSVAVGLVVGPLLRRADQRTEATR